MFPDFFQALCVEALFPLANLSLQEASLPVCSQSSTRTVIQGGSYYTYLNPDPYFPLFLVYSLEISKSEFIFM